MASEQFLWCRSCNAIHHHIQLDQLDQAPTNDCPVRTASEISADTFKDQHAGHKLECLVAAGERYFPTGQKADPMAVVYLEVSNGRDRYLLRGARKNIEQPIQFAMVKGCLADAGFHLQVQEAALRKAMKHHFDGATAPFGDEKIDGFISLVREVIKEIDPGSIRVSGYSTTDSNLIYGQLGKTELDALMVKCNAQFEGAEVECIRRFVEAHRDIGDVMTVLMRRHIAIETAG